MEVDEAEETVEADRRRWSARRLLQWAVIGVPVAAFAVAGWVHRTIIDDGFIYFRIVRQLEAGHGPVFNAGERVEAYTGPLWLAVLWVGDLATPLDLGYVAVVFGILGSVAGLLLGVRGVVRLAGAEADDAFLVPVGLLVIVALVPMWYFQTTGLETGLCFAWLGACFSVLAGWAAKEDAALRWPAAVLLGLGWLIRPELALFSLAFLLVVLLGRPDQPRRAKVATVVWALALPAAYQLFRMGWFGALVANTAIAKEASSTRWDLGWDYFKDFTGPYLLVIPVALLLIGGYLPLLVGRAGPDRARRAVLLAFPVTAALNAVYVIMVGGDYVHGRLLLPALFAFCLPVMVLPLTRAYAGALAVALWAGLAVVSLRPDQYESAAGGALDLDEQRWIFPDGEGLITLEDWGWQEGGPNRDWYEGPAIYYSTAVFTFGVAELDAAPAEDVELPTAALLAIGLPAYAMGTDLQVLDLLGLADPVGARYELSHRGFLPGHEKTMPTPWVLARLVDDGVVGSETSFPEDYDRIVGSNALIPPTSGAELDQQVADARAALDCGELGELLDRVTGPMSAGTFVDNVLGSFSATSLSVPPDPATAYERFC
jgi:arabinofuranosyltransferase